MSSNVAVVAAVAVVVVESSGVGWSGVEWSGVEWSGVEWSVWCSVVVVVVEPATKIPTFCPRLAGRRIPCACHTKRRFNVQKRHEHVVLCTF